MDNEKNNIGNEAPENQPKRLTGTARALFLIAVCVLSFASASLFSVFGIILILAAAGMNVLLALEFSNSKLKLALLLLVNILPFAAAYLYSASLAGALLALWPLGFALPIFVTLKMGLGRSASIALAAAIVFALFTSSFALLMKKEYGAVNTDTIGQYLDTLFEPVAAELEAITYEKDGEAVPYFPENVIDDVIYYTKTMLIGTLGAMTVILAYLATLVTRLIARIFGVQTQLPMGLRIAMIGEMGKDGPTVRVIKESVEWRIELDIITVGVYAAAYLAALLLAPTGRNPSMIYLALQNLVLILSPGFFYCGVRDVWVGFRMGRKRSTFSRILLLIGLVMLIVSPQIITMIFCVLGVIASVKEHLMRRRAEKNRKGDQP